ncbi:hypothetical protein SELMODRAFT_441457 [Selaginella moellendorffii]|uniref:DUF6821 domain-containing protein n=1 Tax=Selaginella moellendorffii TaxID=88036 RepID=D8RJN7_SELML|nr:uncharacterized protein LOC9642102 [Selaginella moellendorffii]EFJ27747.1 hypothetical protein SELMODRAFT_441457 [Selaginella moellendorffii]|eukprot:XP_002971149.1 uncharacterized protein LOC9642102 [Selaginella moellendorffii]
MLVCPLALSSTVSSNAHGFQSEKRRIDEALPLLGFLGIRRSRLWIPAATATARRRRACVAAEAGRSWHRIPTPDYPTRIATSRCMRPASLFFPSTSFSRRRRKHARKNPRQWRRKNLHEESGQQEQHHRQQQQQQQHDLDLLSTLISSVLESEKREGGIAEGGDLQTGTGEEASSLASLHREIVSESGFSALVPSDLHGNVLRPEEQEEGEAIGEEGGGGFGIGEEEDGRIGGSWKKKIASYIRRASTLWSLTIAAALVGLVIIGQRWQHERWQNHQMRLQLCYKDEKISQLLFQIARLKETVSGRRRVPVIKASAV